MAETPEYPEIEKMRAVMPESQAIGAFLEWLEEGGMHICRVAPPQQGAREQWVPVSKSITTLLAEHFEIDLTKVEKEKRAILAEIQKGNTDG